MPLRPRLTLFVFIATFAGWLAGWLVGWLARLLSCMRACLLARLLACLLALLACVPACLLPCFVDEAPTDLGAEGLLEKNMAGRDLTYARTGSHWRAGVTTCFVCVFYVSSSCWCLACFAVSCFRLQWESDRRRFLHYRGSLYLGIFIPGYTYFLLHGHISRDHEFFFVLWAFACACLHASKI